jgi:CheY-like chemotaxis protein
VPQKGSSFYFTIPLEIAHSKIQESKEEIFLISEYVWENKTILIAEDDDLNFMFLEEMLSPTKIKIIRARNGKEAVELVKMIPEISLVLMDIQMPVMDGYECSGIIKTLKPELPIIAQTAYALASEKEMSLKAGCVDYVTKPINHKLLIRKINKYSLDK